MMVCLVGNDRLLVVVELCGLGGYGGGWVVCSGPRFLPSSPGLVLFVPWARLDSRQSQVRRTVLAKRRPAAEEML